jgi:hypothetical protein
MSTPQLRKATRVKSKLRIGLAGVSGSGKTYSALLLARGLVGSWDKVCLIDTENGSADLYSDLGDFNVITLEAPFGPERYIEAIQAAEAGGMEAIIIDSITHEWDGSGGCLEIVEQIAQASSSKNSYTAWAKVTPRHAKFVQAILQSPSHIITTVRRKQDYSMDKDSNGKTTVTKAGLKEITREGFEYELTLSFALSQNHLAEASKDRTGLFMDKPEFKITEKTGEMILAWTEGGVDPKDVAMGELRDATNSNQLLAVWNKYPRFHIDEKFKQLATDRGAEFKAEKERAKPPVEAPKAVEAPAGAETEVVDLSKEIAVDALLWLDSASVAESVEKFEVLKKHKSFLRFSNNPRFVEEMTKIEQKLKQQV